MPNSPSTCWSMIRDAAGGDAAARDRFAALYAPAVRAYLGARWGGGPFRQSTDDAVQDVFVELMKDGGALGKVDQQGGPGFRAFLFGVARNIARRHEQRRQRTKMTQPETAFFAQQGDDDPHLSQVFDRAWAKSLLHEAGRVQHEHATGEGADALRRHELLQLRFGEGLPIRDIAARWEQSAETLHREYAKARKEFLIALLAVLRFHHPDASEDVLNERARELIGLLSTD